MKRLVIIAGGLLAVAICIGAAVFAYLKTSKLLIPPAPPIIGKKADAQRRFHKILSPEERAHILDGQFTILNTVQAMPERLKKAFAVVNEQDTFEMANPGQTYQATDVIKEPGLPFSRLLFAGVSQNKWFVHYEHGGIGHSYAVVVFGIDQQQRVRFLWAGSGFAEARGLEELRRDVSSGKFADDSR